MKEKRWVGTNLNRKHRAEKQEVQNKDEIGYIQHGCRAQRQIKEQNNKKNSEKQEEYPGLISHQDSPNPQFDFWSELHTAITVFIYNSWIGNGSSN